jgi:hypothetical protein
MELCALSHTSPLSGSQLREAAANSMLRHCETVDTAPQGNAFFRATAADRMTRRRDDSNKTPRGPDGKPKPECSTARLSYRRHLRRVPVISLATSRQPLQAPGSQRRPVVEAKRLQRNLSSSFRSVWELEHAPPPRLPSNPSTSAYQKCISTVC